MAKGISAVHATRAMDAPFVGTLCANCGIPLDARYFDESGVATGVDKLAPGSEISLARFELHPQYCGVLELFSQFTDAFANDASQVETPGLEWVILSNHRPLDPYIRMSRVVNPWGYGGFPFSIRLNEGATIEFVIRRVGGTSNNTVTKVGGRIMGRYWYNPAFGQG